MKWLAQAPSNIALIKYMGKLDFQENTAANLSLSYTLNDLLSFVELEDHAGDEDFWEPLDLPGAESFSLPETAQQRFLAHLGMLKKHFNYNGGFTVRSCNNFPTASGLASSASSFAALTKCACLAINEKQGSPETPVDQMAELSRRGSGSSCRSFYQPWALWQGDTVKEVTLPYPELIHHAVIISHDQKQVSSSEAHRRVKTSPNFAGRDERAEQRYHQLVASFNDQDWRGAFDIVWQEFSDMHDLFHSASEPFSYINDDVNDVLERLKRFWEDNNDGPLVTMDAGPNIHLLFRPDQADMAQIVKRGIVVEHDVI